MIFVQIAAYRDPELLPTIRDCLHKAKYPGDLRFGICWQTDEEDHCLDEFRGHPQFCIDRVPWAESRGLGWARSRIQGLYEGEAHTLQLDSHHRFAEGWDEFLLQSLENCGSAKPILTTYAGVYDPATNEKKESTPCKMVADKFTPSGTILFRPHRIPEWQSLDRPVRARFVSGHFFFTLGQHCEEYSYDPDIYFAGDEISLSIRSYTLGYDLFHPHRTVIWHEYTRQGRTKHWDDHTPAKREEGVEHDWWERDTLSKRRLRKLLREEDNDVDLGIHTLGTVRSHHDYERYAGIDFANRRLHTETLAGAEPPCTYLNAEQWEKCLTRHYHVVLRWKAEDARQCDDLQFLYFGVEDDQGRVLHRYDAPPDSPEALFQVEEKPLSLQVGWEPKRLVVWPYSRSRGWLKRTDYPIESRRVGSSFP